MTTRPSLFGQIQMGVSESPRPATATRDTPFRMLILGDFSGRESRGAEPDAGRAAGRPIAIDRDTVDEVFAKLGVEIALPVGEGWREPVRFGELDELHPDHIVDQLGVFSELRALRRRLLNPDSFEAAAEEVSSWGRTAAPSEPPAPEQPSAEPPEGGIPMPDDLLGAVLAESTEENADLRSRTGSDMADRLIRDIVAPFVLPAPDPRRDDLVAAVDTATAAQLRTILHDLDFQNTESGWRALDFLVRRLETDTTLKLYLLDLTKADLAADLQGREALESASLYKLLVEQALETPGGLPWSLLVGNYTFDAVEDDADLLGRMARIAARAGAPFLAAGASALVGCPSFAIAPDPDNWTLKLELDAEEAWAALRGLPDAAYLGLFLPRVLQRLPYGVRGNPIEAFDFEEVPEDADAETAQRAYLWGNPAFAAACLIGQAFTADGWSLRPGAPNQLDGLPLQVVTEHDEQHLLPCAELWLSERGAERMLSRGLTPVWSVKNEDRIRIGPFRSLAGGALGGRWSTYTKSR